MLDRFGLQRLAKNDEIWLHLHLNDRDCGDSDEACEAEGREIDLRISSMPTLLGEKLVIRVLDKTNLHVKMEDLGFRTPCLEGFNRVLKRPQVAYALVAGLFVVTLAAVLARRRPALSAARVRVAADHGRARGRGRWSR